MKARIKNAQGYCSTIDLSGRRVARDAEGFFDLTDADLLILETFKGIKVEPKVPVDVAPKTAAEKKATPKPASEGAEAAQEAADILSQAHGGGEASVSEGAEGGRKRGRKGRG
jgi:hypothetical protein